MKTSLHLKKKLMSQPMSKRILATIMTILMVASLLPISMLSGVFEAKAEDTTTTDEGMTKVVTAWTDDATGGTSSRTTTWTFSTFSNTSNRYLNDGNSVLDIVYKGSEKGSIKAYSSSKSSSDGLSVQKQKYDSTKTPDITAYNAYIKIPVDTSTTEATVTITLSSATDGRYVTFGNSTESKIVIIKSSNSTIDYTSAPAGATETSNKTLSATLSSAAFTDGYIVVTPNTIVTNDSGEIKIASIVLTETKASSSETETTTGSDDSKEDSSESGSESETEPTTEVKLDFTTGTTGVNVQSTKSDITVGTETWSVDASNSGKLLQRTSDAQFNNGTTITIPVSGTGTITVVSYPGYHYYSVSGIVTSDGTGKADASADTQTYDYDSSKATEVVITATATAYLYSITKTPTVKTDTAVDDTKIDAKSFKLWLDDIAETTTSTGSDGSTTKTYTVKPGEYTGTVTKTVDLGSSKLTLVGKGETKYTNGAKVDEHNAYKAGNRHDSANDITSIPSAGAGTLTIFTPAANGMLTVYFSSTSFMRIWDFNTTGSESTRIGYTDSDTGVNEYSISVVKGHTYVLSTTGKTNNMFYAGYSYVVDETVSVPVKVTNVDATVSDSLQISLVDAQIGGSSISVATDATSLSLKNGHKYTLSTNDGGVAALVNGDATFTVTGDSDTVEIKLNDVPSVDLTGNIVGTDEGTVKKLTFTNMTNGTSYEATISGSTYTVTLKPGEYNASVETTNGGVTYDRASVKADQTNTDDVYVEVQDSTAARSFDYTEIENLETTGSVKVESGKTHCVAAAGSTIKIPVTGKATVTVKAYYSADFTINGTQYTVTSKSTNTTDTFSKVVDGDVTIEAAATSYLLSIEVLPVVEFKSEISIPGDYDTFTEAVTAINGMIDRPEGEAGRITINLNKDLTEQVNMTASYVTLKGNDHTISWYYGVATYYYSVGSDGLYNKRLAMDKYSYNEGSGTLWGGVFIVRGDNFIAEDTTFKNTYNYGLTDLEKTDIAGTTLNVSRLTEGANVAAYAYKERSNAFYIEAKNIEVYNCKILSSQDALGRNGTDVNGYSAYFRDCVIGGNVDYICGEFAAVFDNCELQWKTYSDGKNNNQIGYIVAPKTSPYVFRNCYVTVDDDSKEGVSGYLGRTWGSNSNASFINLETNGYISATGWGEMNSGDLTSAIFNEYNITEKGVAFAKTTNCTNNTLEAVANYIDGKGVSAIDTVLDGWEPTHYFDVEVNEDSKVSVKGNKDTQIVDSNGDYVDISAAEMVIDDNLSDEVKSEVDKILDKQLENDGITIDKTVAKKYLDLSLALLSDTSKVLKLDKGTLQVTLTFNDADFTKDIVLYHITGDHAVKMDITTDADKKTITFEADSFSPFVIVYTPSEAVVEDTVVNNTEAETVASTEASTEASADASTKASTDKTTSSVNTGDASGFYGLIALMVICLAAMSAAVVSKRRGLVRK